jgi:hypothetical protein
MRAKRKIGLLVAAFLFMGVASFVCASVLSIWIYCPSDECTYGGCSGCIAPVWYEEVGPCCFNCVTYPCEEGSSYPTCGALVWVSCCEPGECQAF